MKALHMNQMPGKALSLSIGADGSVWQIGTGCTGAGLGIYRWKDSDWEPVEGAAVGLAVGPTGEPWSWNLYGQIYRREGETWREMPGIARYIAIGADGSVWHVGTVETFYTGYGLYRWCGDHWEQVAGAAVGIAVAPDGTPWHWNRIGEIYKREGDTWRPMPGRATHLAIGADGSMWHIGTDQRGETGYGIYKCYQGAWEQVEGAGIGIAVGPDGVPWWWTAHGDIYKAKQPMKVSTRWATR
ncbi:MAG TPA: tectonin domain-containing protein [Nitrospira sp.]|nr:tectonin domain-containing protein [Nitrospira sp.]